MTPLSPRITAAKHIAATMAKSQNKVYLSSDSLFLNIRDTERDDALFSSGGEIVDATLTAVPQTAGVQGPTVVPDTTEVLQAATA